MFPVWKVHLVREATVLAAPADFDAGQFDPADFNAA